MLVKNKIIIKLIISIVLVSFFMPIVLGSNKVFANKGDDIISNIESDIDSFRTQGESAFNNASLNTSEITDNFVGLGQILTMIGAGVMVAVTTYMGIKYLTAGPEAQGKLKTQLIGLVVSGVVIFGAYSIWKLVINIAQNFE